MAKASSAETPLMKQYNALKAKYPETILLFRVGDFYETFGEDAIRASKILGITLTKRANGAASHIELAGFPHHAIDTYLPKLVRGGARVAVCDQLEDPKLAKGIVKRGVTEIVTPGTALSDSLLDGKQANYLAAVYFPQAERAGAAFLELSTGEFFCLEGDFRQLESVLSHLQPAEVIIPRGAQKSFRDRFGEAFNLHRLEDWIFETAYATEQLLRHFNTSSLKGFGIDHLQHGASAAGVLLHYLRVNEHTRLGHINSIYPFDDGQFLALDRFTLRNLEVLAPLHPDGVCLYKVLDHTETAMGGRLLRRWLAFPLRELKTIEARQNQIAALLGNQALADSLTALLGQIGDLERLATRLALGRLNPREADTLRHSLQALQPLFDALHRQAEPAFRAWLVRFKDVTEPLTRLSHTLNEAPPNDVAKGGVIRTGVSAVLDEYRALHQDVQAYLDRLRVQEVQRSGIASLKINYNRVFGYYIEVTKTNADRVPADYIRKQTLAGAERYITPELKAFEEKMLTAEENLLKLETELYSRLLTDLQPSLGAIQQDAQLVAEIDVLLALAKQARAYHYCKPSFVDEDVLEIEAGRHPVIETLLPREQPYVPNDVTTNGTDQQILLITGPNMAGKSALLRQTALIVLLAQVGSYVPARSVRLGLFDKVFTRVGASDNLSAGESTFMVEMNETARILHQATPRSLVLLDEIGRGTATYDGVSIAWALVEYLHNTAGRAAKTLFATHYHELSDLAAQLPRVKNFNVAVREIDGKIIFLRQLRPGSSEHSFGIQVAEMAGVPQVVIRRAKELLVHFERHSQAILAGGAETTNELSSLPKPPVKRTAPPQLQLFSLDDPAALKVRELLVGVDVNRLTPVEALLKLQEIQEAVAKG